MYHNGEFIIFYRDELPYNEKIFVIMHEIGHIEAHHTYAGCILGQGNTIWETDSQERVPGAVVYPVQPGSGHSGKAETAGAAAGPV